MNEVQYQQKIQEQTNETIQLASIRFKKRTSRKAIKSIDWFQDLTLTKKTLEEVINKNTKIISKDRNSILINVNYYNSWSADNNYYFLFSKEDFKKIENLDKYFKNLTK